MSFFRTAITAESLSVDTRAILEEVTRNLNLEKLLPCYKYTVSVACLKVIRILQKFGHLPSNPHLFRAYAAYGQFIGIEDVLICFIHMHYIYINKMLTFMYSYHVCFRC